MVHVTTPKPSLGASLGNLVGGVGGIYAGNKMAEQKKEAEDLRQSSKLREALENAQQIYSNPNLPTEQKRMGLMQALASHPEMAKQFIGQFEQQQQTEQDKLALRAMEKQRGLPEGSLSGFEGNLKIAESASRPQGAPGGVTSQPVPEEVAKNIESILRDNPNASAEDLQVKMTNAKIPPIFTTSFIETRRRDEESKRQKEVEAEKQDYSSFKDNKDYIDKILNGYEAFKRDSTVLNQMQNLTEKGELPTPMLTSVLGKLGLPIGILENPDAEQFEKLSQELMKNIQGTYGSRILQSEVNSFMKSIPTLLSSEEGKKRLVQQWKILNDGKKIYYDSYKELRKNPKYENRLPADLHEKVLDIADPKLDQLSKRFENMNKIPTDYQKTAGKALVVDPNGQVGEIDDTYLQDAIKEGYEYLQ
jgi:hypothetical protein